MLKFFVDGIKAGIMIAIGGSVFLACESKVVGAVLFTVALLAICLKGYNLYTGKICYIPEKHDGEAIKQLLLGFLGNAVSTIPLGFAIGYANPKIFEAGKVLCEAKLLQDPFQTLIRAFFCGVLIYIAVSTYREKNTIAGIVFCIPVFILSGFEHSIANMFYFGAAKNIEISAVIYLAIVVIGNSIGGMAMPILDSIGKGVKKNA